MSQHKARKDGVVNPLRPGSTVMVNGRHALPHAIIDGQSVQGGLHNAIVEGVGRSEEEEKGKVKQFHESRAHLKKEQDPKVADEAKKKEEEEAKKKLEAAKKAEEEKKRAEEEAKKKAEEKK